MKKIFLFFSVVAALLCSSCAKEEPDVWGTISGVVKDAQSNQPIEGVKVTVTATGASQITNSDGQFTFDNLDATEYSLSFEKVGYFTLTQKVTVLAGETATAHVQMKKNLLGINVSPSVLDFGTSTTSLNLDVTSTSGSSVYFSVQSSASWLSVSPSSASVSQSTVIQATVRRGTLSPGSYDALITFSANNESMTVPVHMQVAGAGQPVVTVESIVSVTQTTATVNGVLTLEGGVSVSDYGVCYSTNATPTVNNSKISRGGTSQSTGFNCQLSGLNPGTEYHVRAYAIADGQTYYSAEKTFTTTSQGGGGSGGGTEDYSSAVLRSTNDYVTIELLSCKRQASGNVLMETTILNTGITQNNDFRVCGIGEGQTWDGQNWVTDVSDALFTTYGYYDLYMSLNGKSGNKLGGGVVVPVNSKKKFSITVKNVPQDATSVSVHLACMFYGYPCSYTYLTYDNVPIY